MRVELTTSSLPRKCSTPELQRRSQLIALDLALHKSPPFAGQAQLQTKQSGRRGFPHGGTTYKPGLDQTATKSSAKNSYKELFTS